MDDFESHYDRKGVWVWSFMTVRGRQEERRDTEVKAVSYDEYRRLWRDEEDVVSGGGGVRSSLYLC